MKHPPRLGFTLIELSIVLVIIGLIVGGVLVGKDLIAAAKVRGTIAEMQQLETAFQTFRLKYKALPGDISNATSFFGVDSNGCPASGGATGTCDGNGDRLITGWANEGMNAWKQLSLSGLIKDKLDGSKVDAFPGVNVPVSVVPSAGYLVYYSPAAAAHVLWLAGPNPGDSSLGQGVLSPIDAHALDSKLDDGMANTGRMQASTGQGGGICGAAEYNVTETRRSCFMRYYPSF